MMLPLHRKPVILPVHQNQLKCASKQLDGCLTLKLQARKLKPIIFLQVEQLQSL